MSNWFITPPPPIVFVLILSMTSYHDFCLKGLSRALILKQLYLQVYVVISLSIVCYLMCLLGHKWWVSHPHRLQFLQMHARTCDSFSSHSARSLLPECVQPRGSPARHMILGLVEQALLPQGTTLFRYAQLKTLIALRLNGGCRSKTKSVFDITSVILLTRFCACLIETLQVYAYTSLSTTTKTGSVCFWFKKKCIEKLKAVA